MIAKLPLIESDNEAFSASNYTRYGTKLSFTYNMDMQLDGNTVLLPVTYIPNYVVKVDGVPVNVFKTSDARVAFVAENATGNVTVEYREPTSFRLFELISILSIAAFVFRKKIKLLSAIA